MHHWGKPRQALTAGTETESMEKCGLVASSWLAQHAFLNSYGAAAQVAPPTVHHASRTDHSSRKCPPRLASRPILWKQNFLNLSLFPDDSCFHQVIKKLTSSSNKEGGKKGGSEGAKEGRKNYLQKPHPNSDFQDILGTLLNKGLQSTELFCCFICNQEILHSYFLLLENRTFHKELCKW